MKSEEETDKQPLQNESFQEYRERVHANDRARTQPHKIIRAFFGIFMVILYVGMGILLLMNMFNWSSDWTWCRYIVGIALIAYGIFRGYRQYSGTDYYNS
ncbi:MAG: hypothetical protein K2L80_02650 [Muribaculaceae bacterium]|nr:hypothetical protein [Muribaculaceae bacterium]MDE6331481.1 hypothetical protein [Muribaculaceae bacterium]